MIPLRSAPRWLFIANAFVNMLFVLPVSVLFYEYKGVTIGDFFLIQGISRLFIFVMEVPTGYIGDIFSRKYTVVLGFTTWILGYLLWIFGYGVLPVLERKGIPDKDQGVLRHNVKFVAKHLGFVRASTVVAQTDGTDI